MAEKETVFTGSLKNKGIFSFPSFYNFCYGWLTEEAGFGIAETKYSEKLSGNSKTIEINWTGEKKVTDYFKFEIKIEFKIEDLVDVEVSQGNQKLKTNQGLVGIKLTGTLIRDYLGKFEMTAFKKFLRSTYEKWIIASRIEEYQNKLFDNCEDFLAQVKAYLDLAGKRT